VGSVGAALQAAADERDRLCDVGESPAPALENIAEELSKSAVAFAGLGDGQLLANYDAVQAVALDSGTCTTPSADPAVANATAAITGALDRIYGLRDVAANRSSAVWQHRDRLQTALWVREAIANDTPIDGLVLGNSVSRDAIDPVTLSQATDTRVGQASIGGVTAETAGVWFDEVLPVIDPQTVYLGISYYDLYSRCDTEERRLAAEEFGELRAKAFAGLVNEDRRARWDHLLGPVGSNAYGTSPLLDSFDGALTEATFGREQILDPAPRPDLLQRHISELGRLFTPEAPCVERNAVIAELIAKMQADGREVILTAIPPNPAFVDDTTGGIPGFFADADALAAASGADRYLPLELRIDPEKFKDGVHVLSSGREELTNHLIDALAG
jgi:hypothetical protein